MAKSTKATQEQTPEQVAAQAAEKKAAEAAAKAAAKEAAKAERAAAREAAKAQKDAEKAAAKLQREAERAAAKAEKEAAKEAAKAAREANRMPEQNGVRRPKPDGLCGRAWAIFDNVSRATGSPATIAASLEIARQEGLNESNVKAEYARWRKFNGISGRIVAPKAA